jgi:DNA mismatch repair ATPase MutS
MEKSGQSKRQCVNRELVEIATRGTFCKTDQKQQAYEPKYILCYKKSGMDIGVTFFDVTTLKIFIGQFEDNEDLQKFRTLICQIRPIEII